MQATLFGDDYSAPPAPRDGAARLRDRLLNHGAAGLSDDELLSILVPKGAAHATVYAARRYGGFAETAAETPEALRRSGVEDAAIAALKAVRELALRMLREEIRDRPALSHWQAVVKYLRAAMAGEPREQFRVLFLDKRNRLLRDEVLGDGTIDHAPVYPREVMRRALELNATALILVHNHPSGDPQPSKADVEVTRTLTQAAAPLGIAIHDHLVIGREGHVSMRAAGLL